MSDHKAFCDWLIRNRSSLSKEAFEAGDRVVRWLAVMEQCPSEDTPRYLAEAWKEFMDYYQSR